MFNSFTEIASAFNNLDTLQSGSGPGVNANASDSSNNARKETVDESSFPSLTALTSITDEAMNSISLATSSFNLFGPTTATTTTTTATTSNGVSPEAIPKINTVFVKDLEAEEAFKEEIDRLKVQLEEALYKVDEKANELYKVEVSHQLASQNYEYKIRESEIEIQSLKTELQDQSKHFEDKLSELQAPRPVVATDSTIEASGSAESVSKQEFDILHEKNAILEKKLLTTQNALERKERKHKEAKAELDKRDQEIKDAKLESKAELERKDKECRDLKQEVEQKNTELKAARKEAKRKEKEFHETIDKKSSDIQTLTLQYESVRKDLSSVVEAVEDGKRQIMALQGELQTQQSRIELRDGSVAEQQDKVKTLTEKLRELMKKYTDLKAQYKTLEQSKLDETAKEANEALHAKESELLGMKLKLENTTQQFQEETRMRMQVTDKFGEAQREIARMRESLESGKLTLSELKRENAALSAQVEDLSQQAKTVTEAHALLEIKISRLTAELAETKQQAQERLEAAEQESQDRIVALESELLSLNARVSTEEESASLLDQYKKRAQAAIKKANDQIQELNIEVERLKIELASTQESARADEGAALQASQTIQKLEEDVSKTQGEMAVLLLRVSELETALEAAGAQSQQREDDLQSQITQLTEALRAAQSASQPAVSTASTVITPVVVDAVGSAATNVIPSASESARNAAEDSREDGVSRGSAAATESQVEKIAKQQLKLRSTTPTSSSSSSSSSSSDPPLFLVNELYAKVDELRKQVGVAEQLNVELQSELVTEKEIARSLQTRVEELTAILDRTRKLRDDPDSQVNTEYLKNCIYKYMICTDPKDKLRLSNVVCAVLKLTDQEKTEVKEVLDRESSNLIGVDESLSSIASLATTSFESLFGTPFSTAPTRGRPPIPIATTSSAPIPQASANAGIVPTDLLSSLFSTPVRK